MNENFKAYLEKLAKSSCDEPSEPGPPPVKRGKQAPKKAPPVVSEEQVKKAFALGVSTAAAMGKSASFLPLAALGGLTGALTGGMLSSSETDEGREDLNRQVSGIRDNLATEQANLQNQLSMLQAQYERKIQEFQQKQQDLVGQLQGLGPAETEQLFDVSWKHNNPTLNTIFGAGKGLLTGAVAVPVGIKLMQMAGALKKLV